MMKNALFSGISSAQKDSDSDDEKKQETRITTSCRD